MCLLTSGCENNQELPITATPVRESLESFFKTEIPDKQPTKYHIFIEDSIKRNEWKPNDIIEKIALSNNKSVDILLEDHFKDEGEEGIAMSFHGIMPGTREYYLSIIVVITYNSELHLKSVSLTYIAHADYYGKYIRYCRKHDIEP